MTEPIFDHDRLDVYRLSIQYVASSFSIAKDLGGCHRHARDQWLRAAQSIPLNIAEGNGIRSLKDRSRFLDIARGSALECVAIQDVLAATDGMNDQCHRQLKQILHRIVLMLTRLIARSDVVAESGAEYNTALEYEYRNAEYEYREAEYKYEEGRKPELGRAPTDGLRGFANGKSIVRPK
ncbi:S23 ribosomal protein [Rhodopirellula maiorica SM1]|uniref:S23 ribosomal protein n=1 Tax=Rhodopirellula maiorica SM1 TaxID=1265738 RepID=M5RRB0_9BACT|nr:four helix bundle protein [Rhodopirellula maiorica]EMI21756.1 S23 ribosomal protein [Rhodopirellula maiorica SM1]